MPTRPLKHNPRGKPIARNAKRGWAAERKSRHERGYGTVWDKIRKQILSRDDGLCQPCLQDNRITPAHAVDHIVPKVRGGSDDPSNLQSICNACHNDKTRSENSGSEQYLAGCTDSGIPIDPNHHWVADR